MLFEKFAKSDKTLLITGETGTGKSRLARRLHNLSPRKSKPFIHVNLCNFTSALFESELFGHVRGSFTGAHQQRIGLAESVGSGTLFLDEIGDVPIEVQAKLLMLLEEGLFYPVGSGQPHAFRGRVILATNKSLEAMVEEGTFRKDLHHRIRTFEIPLPALSENANLEELIEEFFIKARQRQECQNTLLSEEVLSFLKEYSWPGNFRELINVTEYLALMGDTVAELGHLPAYMLESPSNQDFSGDYHQSLSNFEKAYLTKKLRERGFGINKTAREIKISKVTLLSKIKKYDIKKEINELHGKAI